MQRDLVLRAAQGDHDAFTALATEAFDRLQGIARLILRDEDHAADAVQETLISAWLHIRTVRDPDRFDAWLHRMLVRACYHEARARKRAALVEIRTDPQDGIDGVDDAAAIAQHDQLDRAFRRLSPEQRAVLVVHYHLGLADGEAAVALDIPIGTVKSRLSRATSALRAALDADERTSAVIRESIA